MKKISVIFFLFFMGQMLAIAYQQESSLKQNQIHDSMGDQIQGVGPTGGAIIFSKSIKMNLDKDLEKANVSVKANKVDLNTNNDNLQNKNHKNHSNAHNDETDPNDKTDSDENKAPSAIQNL